MEENKLTLAKVLDKIKLHGKTNQITYTNMLDPAELAKVMPLLRAVPYTAFGGFEDAERKAIFIGDTSINLNKYLCLIRIESVKALSHRSVLGSILGLGIKREMIGDIIINDNICDVVAMREISVFVLQNLDKVGREKVKVSEKELSEILKVKDTSKTITVTVASPRVDAIISACFGTSREVSAELIRREKVFLNHQEIVSTSKQLKIGDLISVRGYGRAKILSFDGETRKNRTRITICIN